MPRARVCGPCLGGGRQGAQTLRTRPHLSVHCRLLQIRQSIKQGGMDVEEPKGPSSARTRCCLHPAALPGSQPTQKCQASTSRGHDPQTTGAGAAS